jgi:hypothetical protein
MKKLKTYFIFTVALLLACIGLGGCTKVVHTDKLTMPSWACTQTPTGQTRIETRQEYCGRSCQRPVDYKQYEVKVECNLTEWREE